MIAVSVLTARCRQRWLHANADLERPRTAAAEESIIVWLGSSPEAETCGQLGRPCPL